MVICNSEFRLIDQQKPFKPTRAEQGVRMDTEQPKNTSVPKMSVFEDDDEFEEFDIDETEDDNKELKDVTQQWEDDWDDDDVNDDFSQQLKRELESNTGKN
ncbi:unnamed protein product [Cuscuta europaea]|uniref:26S proteasome complex subunit SEM1 n=1 Tax=Cuscuta europaea TaxID=41803 RepID=A0A9P1EPC6_CUSEU|nr:unnamed protein product [Cuscuta europaea]